MVIDESALDALLAQGQAAAATEAAAGPAVASPPQRQPAAVSTPLPSGPVQQTQTPANAATKQMPASGIGTSGFVAARKWQPAQAAGAISDAALRRILRVRVPVIVRLASRSLAIGHIRALSPGAILEFEKSVEDPLELMINNRPVAHGQAIKVGENFGLLITEVGDTAQRIRSLGA